jgi:predicted nucleic acid-binding protein
VTALHIVDSSGWLEYFAGTEHAGHFEAPLSDPEHLIVPVITIYEVFKKILRERGESAALQAAGQMQTGTVVDIDTSLAMEAARHPLPLADSLIYATALRWNAELWTQDEHFKDLPHVRYFPKSSADH